MFIKFVSIYEGSKQLLGRTFSFGFRKKTFLKPIFSNSSPVAPIYIQVQIFRFLSYCAFNYDSTCTSCMLAVLSFLEGRHLVLFSYSGDK